MRKPPFASYLRQFALTVTAAILLVFVAVNLIDPDNEFDWPVKFGRSYQSSILSTKRLFNELAVRPSVLVFGTSRSALISSELVGEPVLNFHALYGNPIDILDFLSRLDEQRIRNIREVLFLIDNICYIGGSLHGGVDYLSDFHRLYYTIRTFNLKKIESAFDKFVWNLSAPHPRYVHDDGYTVPGNEQRYDGGMLMGVERQAFQPSTVAVLGRIDRFAKSHGIKVTYFTPTLPVSTLHELDFGQREKFLRELLKHIGGFFDMSWIDGISENYAYFSDQGHLNYEGMKLVLKRIRVGDNFVTRKNIDQDFARVRPHFGGGAAKAGSQQPIQR